MSDRYALIADLVREPALADRAGEVTLAVLQAERLVDLPPWLLDAVVARETRGPEPEPPGPAPESRVVDALGAEHDEKGQFAPKGSGGSNATAPFLVAGIEVPRTVHPATPLDWPKSETFARLSADLETDAYDATRWPPTALPGLDKRFDIVTQSGGDNLQASIARETGADGLPTVVTAEQMAAIIESGAQPLYRGVQDPAFAEQFRTGDYHVGLGIYGNGTYLSTESIEAAYFATMQDAQGVGSVMVLKPDAVTISFGMAQTEMMAEAANVLGWSTNGTGAPLIGQEDPKEALYMSAGRWATARGYDAIWADDAGRQIVNVLNRTALIVREDDLAATRETPLPSLVGVRYAVKPALLQALNRVVDALGAAHDEQGQFAPNVGADMKRLDAAFPGGAFLRGSYETGLTSRQAGNVHRLTAALLEMAKAWPGVAHEIGVVDFTDELPPTEAVAPYAEYTPYSRAFTFYAPMLDSTPASLLSADDSGWAVGNNARYVAIHEFGHAVDEAYRQDPQFFMDSEVRGRDGYKPISEYAKWDEDEEWAELFAAVYVTPRSEWTPEITATAVYLEELKTRKVAPTELRSPADQRLMVGLAAIRVVDAQGVARNERGEFAPKDPVAAANDDANWALSQLPNVHGTLAGVDPKLIGPVVVAVKRFSEAYPGVLEQQPLEITAARYKSPEGFFTLIVPIASTDIDGSKIQLHLDHWFNVGWLSRAQSDAVYTHWMPPGGDTPKGAVDHELGHVLDIATGWKGSEFVRDLPPDCGKHAATTEAEHFADCYMAVQNAPEESWTADVRAVADWLKSGSPITPRTAQRVVDAVGIEHNERGEFARKDTLSEVFPNATVDLTGFSPQDKRDIERGLVRMAQMFPKTAALIGRIGTAPPSAAHSKSWAGLTHVGFGEPEILFNEHFVERSDAFRAHLVEGARTGYNTPGTQDWGDVAMHEFAHALEQTLPYSAFGDIAELTMSTRTEDHPYYDPKFSLRDFWEPSKRAEQNGNEAFAEQVLDTIQRLDLGQKPEDMPWQNRVLLERLQQQSELQQTTAVLVRHVRVVDAQGALHDEHGQFAPKAGTKVFDLASSDLPQRIWDKEVSDVPYQSTGDLVMAEIGAATGRDGPALVVPPRTLDALVADGWQLAYRGWEDAAHAEQYRSGDMHWSVGVSGNGTYVSLSAPRSNWPGRDEGLAPVIAYTGGMVYDQQTGEFEVLGAVTRIAIDPDARRIAHDDAFRGAMEEASLISSGQHPDFPVMDASDAREMGILDEAARVVRDPGRWAMIHGYDVIDVDNGNSKYAIVLDRTRVATDDRDMTSAEISLLLNPPQETRQPRLRVVDAQGIEHNERGEFAKKASSEWAPIAGTTPADVFDEFGARHPNMRVSPGFGNGRIHKQRAMDAMRQLDRLLNRFPFVERLGLMEQLQRVDFGDRKRDAGKLASYSAEHREFSPSRAGGEPIVFYTGITVANVWWDSGRQWQNQPGWAIDITPAGTITHEFGHAIDEWFRKQPADSSDYQRWDEYRQALNSEVRISGISRLDERQRFAEAFAATYGPEAKAPTFTREDGQAIFDRVRAGMTELLVGTAERPATLTAPGSRAIGSRVVDAVGIEHNERGEFARKDPDISRREGWTDTDRFRELAASDKSVWTGAGDTTLIGLAQLSGADGLPTVVSPERFDRLAFGREVLYRGAEDREHLEQVISGPYYAGFGLYGSGTYFATDRETAAKFAIDDDDRPVGAGIRALLKPDARVIDFSDLLEQIKGDAAAVDAIWRDPGRDALVLGYDAIRIASENKIPGFGPVEPRSGSYYYMVLNRTALVVDDEIASVFETVETTDYSSGQPIAVDPQWAKHTYDFARRAVDAQGAMHNERGEFARKDAWADGLQVTGLELLDRAIVPGGRNQPEEHIDRARVAAFKDEVSRLRTKYPWVHLKGIVIQDVGPYGQGGRYGAANDVGTVTMGIRLFTSETAERSATQADFSASHNEGSARNLRWDVAGGSADGVFTHEFGHVLGSTLDGLIGRVRWQEQIAQGLKMGQIETGDYWQTATCKALQRSLREDPPSQYGQLDWSRKGDRKNLSSANYAASETIAELFESVERGEPDANGFLPHLQSGMAEAGVSSENERLWESRSVQRRVVDAQGALHDEHGQFASKASSDTADSDALAAVLDKVAEVRTGTGGGIDDAHFLMSDGDPEGNPAMAAICRIRGYDGLPTMTDRAGIDAIVAEGGIRLYRGFGYENAEMNAEAYETGTLHSSLGMYGCGTYFAVSQSVPTIGPYNETTGFNEHVWRDTGYGVANRYAGADGVVVEAVLLPGAKIIAYEDAKAEMLREPTLAQRWAALSPGDDYARVELEVMTMHGDVGRWAAMHGYDAIRAPGGTEEETYLNVLNRTKVAVSTERIDSDAGEQLLAMAAKRAPERRVVDAQGAEHDEKGQFAPKLDREAAEKRIRAATDVLIVNGRMRELIPGCRLQLDPKMGLRNAQAVALAVLKVQERFPGTAKAVADVAIDPKLHFNGKTLAQVDPRRPRDIVLSNYFRDGDERTLRDVILDNARTGWSESRTPEEVVIHEIGHVWANARLGPRASASEVRQFVKGEGVPVSSSGYSWQNASEWIAETFVVANREDGRDTAAALRDAAILFAPPKRLPTLAAADPVPAVTVEVVTDATETTMTSGFEQGETRTVVPTAEPVQPPVQPDPMAEMRSMVTDMVAAVAVLAKTVSERPVVIEQPRQRTKITEYIMDEKGRIIGKREREEDGEDSGQ